MNIWGGEGESGTMLYIYGFKKKYVFNILLPHDVCVNVGST